MSETKRIDDARLKALIQCGTNCYVSWYEDERVDARLALIELTELRKTVAALPTTADGVPIVPGMTVWFEDIDSFNGVTGSAVISIAQASANKRRFTIECEDGNLMLANDCYSTESAARAAMDADAKKGATDA